MVCIPHGRFEPLPAGVADGDVGKGVVVPVGDEAVCQKLPEGVAWGRTQDVIAQSTATAVCRPGWVV